MDTENKTPTESSEDVLTVREPEPTAEPEKAAETPKETAETPKENTAEKVQEGSPEDTGEGAEEKLPARTPVKRGSYRGALLFCTTLFGFVLCILILFCCAMTPLRSWLTQYENSQPQYASQAVYDMLFADPDWGLLYDLAGVKNTAFEGKEAYIAYMQAKVGDQDLTCTETAFGLSGDRRYLLRCNGETVAAFCMTGSKNGDFTNWSLSDVDVYFTRSESAVIVMPPEYTAYVNGVALDDSYTNKTVHTIAEEHLPEGVHGYRWEQQAISGLLVPPEIVVLDENNNPVPVTYSEETGIYSTAIPVSPEITDEEYALVVEAAETQALFAIRKINISKLRQHFASGSEIYTQISSGDPFVKTVKSYTFDEDSISVTDFYRYSGDLFSARVTLKMDVTVKWKTVETYEIDTTYFFTRSNGSTYLVTDSTDADLQKQITQVTLTYMQGDTVLALEAVRTDAKTLTPPATADTPLGWGKLEADGSLTTILEAQDDGTFSLAEGQTLDCMTLFPIFEAAVAEE